MASRETKDTCVMTASLMFSWEWVGGRGRKGMRGKGVDNGSR